MMCCAGASSIDAWGDSANAGVGRLDRYQYQAAANAQIALNAEATSNATCLREIILAAFLSRRLGDSEDGFA